MASAYENELDAFEVYQRLQEHKSSKAHTSVAIGLPALGHALAGSIGTAVSHLALYPLDLAITRLQVQRQTEQASRSSDEAAARAAHQSLQQVVISIYRDEGGLSAFYTGCVTDTFKSILDAFLFFLAYSALRQRRRLATGRKALSAADELGIGMLSSALSKFVTTPISQIVTRKQTAALQSVRHRQSVKKADSHALREVSSSSIKHIVQQIYTKRGLTGFWAGYSATLFLTLNPALTFLFQTVLRRSLFSSKHKNNAISPQSVFLIAALSKAAASSVTYPFSVAKTRAQIQLSTHASQERETIATASPTTSQKLMTTVRARARVPAVIRALLQTYQSQGPSALYAGLGGELIKGFLGHGLTMLLKDRIHIFVVGLYFLILKLHRRWSVKATGTSLVDQSKEAAESVMDIAGKEVARVKALVQTSAEDAGEIVRDAAEIVVDGVKGILGDT